MGDTDVLTMLILPVSKHEIFFHLLVSSSIFPSMSSIIFLMFILFIFRDRDKERVSREGAEREGESESQAGSILSAQSPTWSLIPQPVRS